MTEQQKNKTETKKTKAKGPLRLEAIIPVGLIFVGVGLYFHFLFDYNLKKAFEWAGYNIVGAEVDIAKLETSFFNASIRIRGIELTDSEKPTHNSINIGDIRFAMSWDALLRGKILVNEAAVEQIEFAKPRAHTGKVKPPEPPQVEKPSVVAQEAEKLKNEAIAKAQTEYNDNILGDLANSLGGGSTQVQMDKLQQNLASKEMAKKLEEQVKQKQTQWQDRLKSLPQGKDFQSLGDRLGKVKMKDFKSPQELQSSLNDINAIFKEADEKFKQLQTANNDFNQDIANIQNQMKDLENQIKLDVKALEAHFKIPSLDAKAITMGLFRRYMNPYLSKFTHYKTLADKYVPPNLMKKNTPDEVDNSIKPHPREKGVTYEFGRQNSYPLFWIKKTLVSSQAGTSPFAGNIKGQITDITSNQSLIGKPTMILIEGDFPSAQLQGLYAQMTIDNTKLKSIIYFVFGIKSYVLETKDFIKNDDVQIGFTKAVGSLQMKSNLIGLREFKMNLENKLTNVDYVVSAKNQTADEVLKKIFKDIPVITLTSEGHGELPGLALDIESNLGTEIQKGFEKQVQAKIKEAKVQIEKYVNDQVGAQKAQIEGQINQIKSQVDGEIKKLQAQADSQKKSAEAKTDQAKKDSENQAKHQVEDQAKKAAEELKKKLGL